MEDPDFYAPFYPFQNKKLLNESFVVADVLLLFLNVLI